jgi:hypothetical protein
VPENGVPENGSERFDFDQIVLTRFPAPFSGTFSGTDFRHPFSGT